MTFTWSLFRDAGSPDGRTAAEWQLWDSATNLLPCLWDYRYIYRTEPCDPFWPTKCDIRVKMIEGRFLSDRPLWLRFVNAAELMVSLYPPPSSQSADQAVCAWLSVTVLVEEVSVLCLSCAGSVLGSVSSELLRSVTQREWPVLIQQQGRPSVGPHIHTDTMRGASGNEQLMWTSGTWHFNQRSRSKSA